MTGRKHSASYRWARRFVAAVTLFCSSALPILPQIEALAENARLQCSMPCCQHGNAESCPRRSGSETNAHPSEVPEGTHHHQGQNEPISATHAEHRPHHPHSNTPTSWRAASHCQNDCSAITSQSDSQASFELSIESAGNIPTESIPRPHCPAATPPDVCQDGSRAPPHTSL